MRHLIPSTLGFLRTAAGATTAAVGGAAVLAGAVGLQASGRLDARVDSETITTTPSATASVNADGSASTTTTHVFEIPGAGTVELLSAQGALVVSGITTVPGMAATLQQANGAVAVLFTGAQSYLATFTAEGDHLVSTVTDTATGAVAGAMVAGPAAVNSLTGQAGGAAAGIVSAAQGAAGAVAGGGTGGAGHGSVEVSLLTDSSVVIELP